MAASSRPPRLTAARKQIANDTSATFYGILATLTAALAVRADQLTVEDTVVGAMIVGLVGLANRWFMDALKLETELGRQVTLVDALALLRQSVAALLFPGIGAAMIGLGSLVGVPLAQAAFYLGVLMAFISAFLSSQRILPALRRGSTWAALTILLLLIRRLVT